MHTNWSLKVNIGRHKGPETSCKNYKHVAPMSHVDEPVSEIEVQCQWRPDHGGDEHTRRIQEEETP